MKRKNLFLAVWLLLFGASSVAIAESPVALRLQHAETSAALNGVGGYVTPMVQYDYSSIMEYLSDAGTPTLEVTYRENGPPHREFARVSAPLVEFGQAVILDDVLLPASPDGSAQLLQVEVSVRAGANSVRLLSMPLAVQRGPHGLQVLTWAEFVALKRAEKQAGYRAKLGRVPDNIPCLSTESCIR